MIRMERAVFEQRCQTSQSGDGAHQLLHAQTAVLLRMALVNYSGIVITSVPYRIRERRRDS